MVQVQINLQYNFDFRAVRLVPSAFSLTVTLNTAFGARHELYDLKGAGGIEEAEAAATAWVYANLLEYDNPSCRPLRYVSPGEQ